MLYLIKIDEFYKIWFSKNPDQALGIENELALVRLREKHPSAKITLVYSSACLNDNAKIQLYGFCHAQKIQLFDFDTDLKVKLKKAVRKARQPKRLRRYSHILSPFRYLKKAHYTAAFIDWALYHKAKEEITRTLNNTGGNFAAASDITRLLTPVATKGMYSDFDVELDVRQVTAYGNTMLSPSPILLPAESASLSMNNEFLAIARIHHNNIHRHAQTKLTKLKTTILNNYKYPGQTFLRNLIKGDTHPLSLDPVLALTVQHIFKQPGSTIFYIRQYIEKSSLATLLGNLPPDSIQYMFPGTDYTSLTEEYIQTQFGMYLRNYSPDRRGQSSLERGQEALLKYQHMLYNSSVIQMTGPSILRMLIEKINQYSMPLNAAQAQKIFVQVNHYNVQNSPLARCIQSKNTISAVADGLMQNPEDEISLLDQIGTYCHQSWTRLGAKKKAQREENIKTSAAVIAHAWQRYKRKTARKTVLSAPESLAISIQSNTGELKICI